MNWFLSLIATQAYAAGDPIPLFEEIKQQIVNPVIRLAFAVAFLYFLYGVVQFIMADDKTRDVGKKHIMYGIIGLFIMTAAFGLVNFICVSVGFCS